MILQDKNYRAIGIWTKAEPKDIAIGKYIRNLAMPDPKRSGETIYKKFDLLDDVYIYVLCRWNGYVTTRFNHIRSQQHQNDSAALFVWH